ncbi:MAG: acyl carrier protein [Alphaproteobacteria bacterium]
MDKARKLIAEALDIPETEILDDASLLTLGAWDSMGHMRIVLAIEEVTGTLLDPDAVADLFSIEDVSKLLP